MSLPPDARRVWLSSDVVEDPRRLRKHLLAAEVRKLVDHAALLDLSVVDEATLDALVEQTRALSDTLEALPSLRAYGGAAMGPDEDAALVERSPFSGRANPLAPPMVMEMRDDSTTRAHAVWTSAYEGPAGCVHGGFVAAAFDDLMGLAQMASGIAGFTGTLTVKMIRPTPLYVRIDYAAGLDRVDGRKIWCWATSHHGDELLAEASIVFIAPRHAVPQ